MYARTCVCVCGGVGEKIVKSEEKVREGVVGVANDLLKNWKEGVETKH